MITVASDTVQKTQTCLVTIAYDGFGDKVLKISPAIHAAERVWLNTAPGKQRWDEIRRTLGKYLPRGVDVPKAKSYHDNTKKLNVVTLADADIPLCQLENHIFEPGDVNSGVDVWMQPGVKILKPLQEIKAPKAVLGEGPDARVSMLENAVVDIASKLGEVSGALAGITKRLEVANPAPAKRGRPAKVKK